MTKEKQKVDLARSAIWILIALAFGAYLGSPVEKFWEEPVSRVSTAVSEQIIRLERLHNDTNEENDAENNREATDADNQKGDGAVSMIVSNPAANGLPDYACLSANRGGAASRKEMDVLVRLINAEAYGLSYKAKLAVGQVVMNRWTGPFYGNDLLAIMTAPHQFTPIHNGSAYEKEIEPDSIKAANAVLNGTGVRELTDDTYYFVNPDFTEDKTIETKMQFVCEIEGIHFYKPPAN